MHVEGAVCRNIQHSLRQDQPVGRHHQHIGLQRGQCGPIRLFPEVRRLKDRNAQFPRRDLDIRLPEPASTPGRAIRLGIGGQHFSAFPGRHGPENLRREIRRAHKDNAKSGICHSMRRRRRRLFRIPLFLKNVVIESRRRAEPCFPARRFHA